MGDDKMKKIALLCLTTLLMLTLFSCGKKEYPYKLSNNKTEKFIDGFSSFVKSDGNITLKPSDIEVYQINKDEQAAVVKSQEESEEFIVILDNDYNLVANIFVNSEDEKKSILYSDETPNITVEKSSFSYDGNIDAKFKEALIEAATGSMLDALKNAESTETKVVKNEIKMGEIKGTPYVAKVVYYYEISVINEQGNSITGLFRSSSKNYINRAPIVYVYYDGLK